VWISSTRWQLGSLCVTKASSFAATLGTITELKTYGEERFRVKII
jgi:hypothetical protein